MQRDLFIEQNARIKVVRVRIENLTLILLVLNLLIWLYATVPAIVYKTVPAIKLQRISGP